MEQKVGSRNAYVICRIGSELYGVEADKAAEIVRSVSVTNIPLAPSFIKGICNLRGSIVTVLDSRKLFRLSAAADGGCGGKFILIKEQEQQLALEVDELLRIMEWPDEQVQLLSRIGDDYLHGIVSCESEGDLVRILDHRRLFELISSLNGSLTGKARSRKDEEAADLRVTAEEEGKGSGQYVLFGSEGARFALPIYQIQDIQPAPPKITPLKDAPEYVLGLAPVRGELTLILDAAYLLGISRSRKPTRILLVHAEAEEGARTVGLAVEEVTDICRYAASDVRTLNGALGKLYVKGISGACLVNGTELVFILDSNSFLPQELRASQGEEDRLFRSINSGQEEGSCGGDGDMQLVFFETGKERFGIPAFLVKEIMQPVPVTPVPHSPSPIAGIVNVRGHLLKVIDLFERLGLTDRTDTGSRRMIVIETEGREAWVIVVDRVIGMRRIGSSQLSATSGWNDFQRTEPWFQGIVTVNNGLDVKELSVMLDLEHMV